MTLARFLSARALITLVTTALTLTTIVILVAVVRDSLADNYAAAVGETVAALWTVGVFLTLLIAIVMWSVSSRLLQPITDLRRDLTLAARNRAVAVAHAGELDEVRALRMAMAAALGETDERLSLAQAEKLRLLGLFEAISEGIVQIGPGGRFSHVNAAARRLLNLPVDAEGKTARTLLRNVELRELMERAGDGNVIEPAEIVIDQRRLLVASQLLPQPQGQNAGAAVAIVDLTELRRIESVRRDFVANVSHELKTPLTSIRGYTETLLGEELPRAAQVQFLEIIDKNTGRIQRIVDDLLDLSRLQSGGWRPELQPVDAQALAREVLAAREDTVVRKQLTFEIIGGATQVVADPGGLRQILSNLFDNSIQYTQSGGRVEFAIRPAGRYLELSVRDNGIGIPSDELPRIFERFYRVDPARSRREGGTGLGLAIVRHLVERMGGDVTAESELGKGTLIKVRLPAVVNDG